MSFLQIPGNIKQQFAPFVLNNTSPLLSAVGSSADLKGNIAPQYFTFRNKQGQDSFPSGIATLQFYPSSMKDLLINDDISYQLLYGSGNDNKMTPQSLTISNVLDHLPAIQIREFLPDTRLDQCINMFVDFFSNMTKLFTQDKTSNGSSTPNQQPTNKDDEQGFFTKVKNASWYTMKYLVGGTKPSFFEDLGSVMVDGLPFSSYNKDFYSKDKGLYVMAFPYTLYYRLQTCVTTNIYEIPAIDQDKRILASGDGKKGWGDGSDFMSAGGFRVAGLLNKIPLIGNIANMILGNIGINYMPWWNAESGAKTIEPAVNLKFELFNDSYEAALANFLFVNTIVPNNKWIQYNMFQHSSNLYDVKIEGLNRLYACAGDINVTYDGILRDLPSYFIECLVKTHANPNMSSQFFQNIVNNKLIKIPDVYHVSLNFQSLLPANFNNFIFNYAENAGHLVKYSKQVYDESSFSTVLPKAMYKFGKRVAAVWNSGATTEAAADAAGANANVEIPKAAKQTDAQKQQQADSGNASGSATTKTSTTPSQNANGRSSNAAVR